jgi:multicomponent Na+:H+ antiporter subunit E
MSNLGAHGGDLLSGSIARAIAFFLLWLIISGADPTGLPAGAVAVGAATWASLRLLPVNAWRFSPIRLTILALHYLRQSVIAGVRVAWLALNPRLPLRLGFVTYAVQLAPGAARNTFCTLSSLLPGTLPAGLDERGALIIHCLDIREPIAAQLNTEEALLVGAVGGERKDV